MRHMHAGMERLPLPLPRQRRRRPPLLAKCSTHQTNCQHPRTRVDAQLVLGLEPRLAQRPRQLHRLGCGQAGGGGAEPCSCSCGRRRQPAGPHRPASPRPARQVQLAPTHSPCVSLYVRNSKGPAVLSAATGRHPRHLQRGGWMIRAGMACCRACRARVWPNAAGHRRRRRRWRRLPVVAVLLHRSVEQLVQRRTVIVCCREGSGSRLVAIYAAGGGLLARGALSLRHLDGDRAHGCRHDDCEAAIDTGGVLAGGARATNVTQRRKCRRDLRKLYECSQS